LRKEPLAGAATPREREHQIAPKKARHFSLKITHSRRSSVSFDRPLPSEKHTRNYGRAFSWSQFKGMRADGQAQV